jgi:diadenosine tetraphosphate (Ap4A) HIT family hydrolase
MQTNLENTKCLFCDKFDIGASDKIHPIFDKIIWNNEDFVIVPAKGSLVEGYLLIIPRKHYHSMAHLPSKQMSDLARIKSAVRGRLETCFGNPIFFEHGPVCKTNPVGSCIDHAHLHCVPFKEDLVPIMQELYDLKRISKYCDIAEALTVDQSYMYYESQAEEQFVFFSTTVPSQYFRKIIAVKLGIPYEWDWSSFEFEEKAASTLEKIQSFEIDMLGCDP